jgi:hypothetical protein
MAHINADRCTDLGTVATLTAAGLGTVTGAVLDTHQSKGCLIFINVTAISGTSPTLTVTLKGVDSVSGASYTILASAAINATGMTVLRVYPGLTAAANSVANDVTPIQARIDTTIGGTTPSVTATISMALIY